MTTPTTADLAPPLMGPMHFLTFPTNEVADLLRKMRTPRATAESPTQAGHGVVLYTMSDLVGQ